MKIFVLGLRGFPNVLGGVEKHCEQLYPRLVKMGYDITVLTRKPYIPMNRRVNEWNGVKFIHIWCPHSKSFEAIIHSILGVLFVRLFSPDLLHIHAIGPAIVIPLARMLGLKVVLTHHGPDYQRQKWGKVAKTVLRIGEFCGHRFANRIIVITKIIKKHLDDVFERDGIDIIPNGIADASKKEAGPVLAKYNLQPGNYIFSACRLVPEKGLHDLIQAYLKIEKKEYKLVIAGDADHNTNYSRDLKKLADNKAIIFTGNLFGEQLSELFSNAGLFVLPSYYEGLPIALLEALSYNLPVLVSNIPQHQEVELAENRYFNVGDVEDLERKIIKLFPMGISAEEEKKYCSLIKEYYNWDKIAEKVSRVYKTAQM